MNLDLFSVSIMTALVVNVSGIVFIVDTLIRRDDGAGRIWTLAFLSAMLTTITYMVWAYDASAWWAVAIGNGAFVAGTGCMWLGCRSFNARRMAASSAAVGAAVVVVALAAALEGPDGGDWAGALAMFVALLVFAGLGAVECLRGEMVRIRTSWGLAFVLGLQCAFYVVRTGVFVFAGADSALFTSTFGTINTSFLTVVLTIVAVVTTSVLRAGRTSLRGAPASPVLVLGGDGVVPGDDFERALGELTERARARGELVGVIAVRIEDLEQISTAFGRESAAAVAETWRAAVRRYAPSSAFVGEDGPVGLVVGVQPLSEAEARRQAALVYRGVFDELSSVADAVIPVIGVGVGLSDVAGYEVAALMERARDAAQHAAMSVDSSVLVAEDDAAGDLTMP